MVATPEVVPLEVTDHADSELSVVTRVPFNVSVPVFSNAKLPSSTRLLANAFPPAINMVASANLYIASSDTDHVRKRKAIQLDLSRTARIQAPMLSSNLTNSATESTFSFSIARPRCTLTVDSVVPNSN